MRRSASEVIRNLEMRVARLEKMSSASQTVMGYLAKNEFRQMMLRGGKMSNAGHLYIPVDGVNIILGADAEDQLFIIFRDQFNDTILEKDLDAEKYVDGGRVNISALEKDIIKLYRTLPSL